MRFEHKCMTAVYGIYEWLRAESSSGWHQFNISELVELTGLKRKTLVKKLKLGLRAGLFQQLFYSPAKGICTIFYTALHKVAFKFGAKLDRLHEVTKDDLSDGFVFGLKREAIEFQSVRNQQISLKAAKDAEKERCDHTGQKPKKPLSYDEMKRLEFTSALVESQVPKKEPETLVYGSNLESLEDALNVSVRTCQRYQRVAVDGGHFHKFQTTRRVDPADYPGVKKFSANRRSLSAENLIQFKEQFGFGLNQLVQRGDLLLYKCVNLYKKADYRPINPKRTRQRLNRLRELREQATSFTKPTPELSERSAVVENLSKQLISVESEKEADTALLDSGEVQDTDPKTKDLVTEPTATPDKTDTSATQIKPTEPKKPSKPSLFTYLVNTKAERIASGYCPFAEERAEEEARREELDRRRREPDLEAIRENYFEENGYYPESLEQ